MGNGQDLQFVPGLAEQHGNGEPPKRSATDPSMANEGESMSPSLIAASIFSNSNRYPEPSPF